MPATFLKKNNKDEIKVDKKMRNYNQEPVFKKKAADAADFLEHQGLPKIFTKKK